MKQLALTLLNVLVICAMTAIAQVDVLTQHNDLNRTGFNSQETKLNTKNVQVGSFAKLFSCGLDDQVYAQPLVATAINLPGVGSRNVVIVATVNNSIYAFDADSARQAGAYWHVNFTPSGTRPPQNTDFVPPLCGFTYHDFQGKFGIVGTPVIDKTAGTIYVVTRSVSTDGNNTFVQYLHALDITTGADKTGSPVIITAQVNGVGYNNSSVGGVVSFDPKKQNQRPGLLLLNGIVYIGYASHCDWDTYYGWLLGYDATTLQQKIVYNTAPGAGRGGIWMSGGGPSADALGNIYVGTGNGLADSIPNAATNMGESVIKLTPSGSTLSVNSFFTPYNYSDLDNADLDFGPAQVMLIPNTQLAVTGSKEGKLYVMDRSNMGGYSATSNNVLQSINIGAAAHMHTALSYYKGTTNEFVYTWPENSLLRAIPVDRVNNDLDSAGTVVSGLQGPIGNAGSMLSVSSNGAVDSTAVLWVSHSSNCDANQAGCPGVLRAVNANNVTQELWNSNMVATDNVGIYAKNVCPTIANGKVYLPNFSDSLLVYGLTGGSPDTCNSANIALNTTATASSVQSAGTPASAAFDGNLSTWWSSNSTNSEWIYTDLTAAYNLCSVVLNWNGIAAVAYNIQVSNDASTWTTISTVTGANPAVLTTTINLQGQGRYVRMQGVTPGTAGGNYSIAEMSVYGQPVVTCAPPTTITATNEANGATQLKWPAVGNATGYTVQYRNVSVSDWTTITTTVDSAVLPALSCGYDYLYQVGSTCAAGQQSAFSPQAGFSTATCPTNCEPLPTRWSTDDVGNVGVAGSACYNTEFFVYTVNGSGTDIGGTADAFRFAYVTVVGDDQIVAHIAAQDNSDPDNKAGIMIRESTDDDARNVFVGVTSGQGAVFQYRTSTGGNTTVVNVAGIAAPYWVELIKIGSTYAAYLSPDGINWTEIGSPVVPGFGANGTGSFAGFAVTSHNNTVLSTMLSDAFTQSVPTTNPLAMTLISFTGQNINDEYADLKWTTATEDNTDSFEVQRSTDGVHFRTLQTIKAVGNSQTPQNYEALDHSPAPGSNAYRLKEVDVNGDYTYSPEVVLRFGKKAYAPLVYPNPVDAVINIIAGQEQINEIDLYDVSGRVLRRLLNGSASSPLIVPCGNLAPGVYFVAIVTPTQRYVKKIVKQ
jgi:F5/8 type C domain/Secretion system C-terminal sorting domain